MCAIASPRCSGATRRQCGVLLDRFERTEESGRVEANAGGDITLPSHPRRERSERALQTIPRRRTDTHEIFDPAFVRDPYPVMNERRESE